MAGSRFERIGTIFSRTTGIIRSGGINYEDRPLWYDVYRVFPPKYEPHFDRKPVLSHGMTEEVPDILYKEDPVRAAFYHKYGHNPGGTIRNLTNLESRDISQDFVDHYNDTLKAHPDWTMEQIIDEISPNYSFVPTTRQRYKKVTKVQVTEGEGDLEMGQRSRSGRDGQRRPVLTAESLLSMFKEAKEKDKGSGGNEEEKK